MPAWITHMIPITPSKKQPYRPVHYISIDTSPNGRARMFDSRTNEVNTIDFAGVRSFLHEYINKLQLDIISIHESHLPQKTQILCWYRM